MTDEQRIANIRKRLSEATPGPWCTNNRRVTDYEEILHPDYKRGQTIISLWLGDDQFCIRAPKSFHEKTFELIAHTPSDIAFLLDLVERLQKPKPDTSRPPGRLE